MTQLVIDVAAWALAVVVLAWATSVIIWHKSKRIGKRRGQSQASRS